MKTRRIAAFVCAALLSAAMIAVGCFSGVVRSAAAGVDGADACFYEAAGSLAADVTDAERTPLYDENGSRNGWQYTFTSGGISGYALVTGYVINGMTVYETAELSCSAVSPFAECEGLPVYITYEVYLDLRGGEYFDLATGEEVSADEVYEMSRVGFGYSGTGTFTDITQTTASYSRKETTDEYAIPYDLPAYASDVGTSNCANVAGSVAIGYYDRFCTELIPDYQTYQQIGPIFRYKSASSEISAVQSELHELMGTDDGYVGTTFAGFELGMSDYADERGYTYESYSVFGSDGAIDLTALRASLVAGRPVALFLYDYAIVSDISVSGGRDVITSRYSSVTHVAMCCGYRVDTYYDAQNNVTDERVYLRIVVGLNGVLNDAIGYLNINGDVTTINHAISVSIA